MLSDSKVRIFKFKNSSNSILILILVEDFWKWITSVLNKDIFCKGFSYFLFHTNILMKLFDENLIATLKIYSQFLKVEFFLISKFQESFMKYKWVVMYMIYRTKLLLIIKESEPSISGHILICFEVMIIFSN